MNLELHKQAARATLRFFVPFLIGIPVSAAVVAIAFYAPVLLLASVPVGFVAAIYVIEYRGAAEIEKIRQKSGGLSG